MIVPRHERRLWVAPRVASGYSGLSLVEGNRGKPPLPAEPRHRIGGRMLVLTRKTNQSIMIGDEIEVSVLAVARDKIRLGITAPRDVPVYRKEVYLSIKEEAAEADAVEARAQVRQALDNLANSD